MSQIDNMEDFEFETAFSQIDYEMERQISHEFHNALMSQNWKKADSLFFVNLSLRTKSRLQPLFYTAIDNLPLFKWVYSKIQPIDSHELWNVFCRACENGNLKTAKWIFQQKLFDIKSRSHKLFNNVCMNGHFKVMEWLRPHVIELSLKDGFSNACKNGHLNIAKRIHFMNPSLIEINKHHFKTACIHGHLKVVKWLFKKLNYDFTLIDDKLFRDICYLDGNFEVAKWMISIQPNIDICQKNNLIFKSICRANNVEMAKWLFSLKPDMDIYEDDFYLFYDACIYGRLELAQWLFSLKPDLDISKNEEELFRDVCENNHIFVVKWLLSIKPDINIQVQNHIIFRTASENYFEKEELIHWLISLFPHLYGLEIDTETGESLPIILHSQRNFEYKEIDEVIECSICWEVKSTMITSCNHQFCKECLTKWLKKSSHCPNCRNTIEDDNTIFIIKNLFDS